MDGSGIPLAGVLRFLAAGEWERGVDMPKKSQAVEVIDGRPCDGCTVCCTIKAVVSDAFVKPPGVRCAYCADAGCSIYQQRPDVCAGYQCGWRFLPWLPQRLRPDRSGVIVDPIEPPAGYALAVTVCAVTDTALFQGDDLREVIRDLIRKGVAVYLSLSKGAGSLNAVLFANAVLGDAVAARDGALLAAGLRRLALALNEEVAAPYAKLSSSVASRSA
jgi:hypothetical protein